MCTDHIHLSFLFNTLHILSFTHHCAAVTVTQFHLPHTYTHKLLLPLYMSLVSGRGSVSGKKYIFQMLDIS